MIRRAAALALALAAGCSGGSEGSPDASTGPACTEEKGSICTWAGTGFAGFDGDGKALTASQLNSPADVAFDPGNTPYVIDWGNHRIRKVVDGAFQTAIGTGEAGDGEASKLDTVDPGAAGPGVALTQPSDLLFLPDGTAMLACWRNHKLRRLAPSGNVRVFAGSEAGFKDGVSGLMAQFNLPSKLAVNAHGEIFVVDQGNLRVRKVKPDGSLVVTPIGSGTAGYADGTVPADAKLSFDLETRPGGALAFDAQGNLFVADSLNHRIRKVEFVESTDTLGKPILKPSKISLFAGTGEAGWAGDGGPALEATFHSPVDLAIAGGKLYVADSGNHAVRAIDLASKVVTTVAGNGQAGFSGDGGPATQASLSTPFGVAVDSKGALYIADSGNNRIRRVVP